MSKKISISFLIFAAVLAIYFGSYLPLVKAHSYIQAIRATGSVNTLEEFEAVFAKPLAIFSPIGQAEIVKFMGSDIGTLAAQNNSEAVSRALVSFLEPHLFKNDVIHLLIGANFYDMLWRKYQVESDFVKAEKYYREALAIGPKLPPILYGLLDLYQAHGDGEKFRDTAKIVLQYWPEDENVRKIFQN